MPLPWTQAEWVKRAQQLHGVGKFDYSRVRYKEGRDRVKIGCNTCGTWFHQIAKEHTRKSRPTGCATCRVNNTRMTQEEFIRRAKQKHGDLYDYSKVVYQHANAKVEIRCTLCNEWFQQRVWGHLQGQGCSPCGRAKQAFSNMVLRSTTADWITKAKRVHGDRYDYSKVEFTGCFKKVLLGCKRCKREWLITATNHLRGNGCGKCRPHGYSIAGSQWIAYIQAKKKITLQHFDTKEGEYRLPELKRRVDGYHADTKTVYQFHGDFWHGNLKVYRRDYWNKPWKMTMADVNARSEAKDKAIVDAGYKLVVMWERDWNILKRAVRRMQGNYRRRHFFDPKSNKRKSTDENNAQERAAKRQRVN